MTVAAYAETDPLTKVECTGPDNPLPRFSITTGNHTRIEISVPVANPDALTFLTAVIDTCQQLREQIAKGQKAQ